ncbi:MAG TPA: ATP-grasp domain-containing protein [Candidatus Polarisedimenticolaceae bacterium]|nr:ATP-grasp domain-containing protein [Candidatus Polarisedimenticolaceae bacterium]
MANVLVIQPGFPLEIPYYVRGLARAGARVLGVGDQPAESLPAPARESLAAYLQVGNLWDAAGLIDALRRWDVPVGFDRVEALWEPAMEIAAEIRRAFGLPGLDAEHTTWFRDKHRMRQRLEQAGVRNIRFARVRGADEVPEAAERVGFPLIVKPVAGAGASHTYRVDGRDELIRLLPALGSVGELAVEEFVDGTEFTFDTLCAGGRILFHNILRYTPTMLESRSNEWISPQNMVLRDLDRPEFRRAFRLGEQVLRALEFRSGITHMEWFLRPDGEAVFCEIAARPPGGMTGELMNYCCDFDVYRALGSTILHGTIDQPIERKYNVAMVFKRAIGQGRIRKIEGLAELYRRFGPHVVRHELLPLGARRRDWKQTLISDGFVILRHPDLAQAERMSRFVAENVRLYAG